MSCEWPRDRDGRVPRRNREQPTMIRTLIAAIATVLLGCGAAFSQIGTGAPVPSPLGITSPLGMAPGSPVPPAGTPMGATELASPGLSSAPAGTIGATGSGTTCLAMGNPSPGLSGSSATFDGGGTGTGTGTSLPGSAALSGACGTSSTSSAATSPASPGGLPRAGIPLGSVEIGNAGVSQLLIVPAPMPSPSMTGSGVPCSTTPPSMSSTGC
jgi:hypothetical protein